MKYCILIFFLLNVFASCSTSTIRTKEPVFKVSTTNIENDIGNLVTSKGININGKENTENGNVTSELEIQITNGQNIPTDDLQMMELGRKIATVFKNALKDTTAYHTFRVLFITETENAGITNQTWKGKTFSMEEL